MFARSVAVAADPIAIARALASRPGLSLMHTASGSAGGPRVSYVACDPDGETSSLDPLEGRAAVVGAGEFGAAPAFVGIVPYEAFRALERPRWSPVDDRPPALRAAPRWRRYPAVIRVDHDRGEVLAVGSSRGAVDDLARRAGIRALPSPAPSLEARFSDADEAHAARVRAAIELIHAGDLYQVNVARSIELSLSADEIGPRAYVELHARLASAAPSPFAFTFIDDEGAILGTSPELCLRADPSADARRFGRLLTEPIKGTRPRGIDAASDLALAAELDADEKERAELAMIVDVERNDLHRVSTARSVRLLGAPRVVTHRTIHHRVARLVGEGRPDLERTDVLRAFLPSGSVTGAPKIRAMEVIRTLETHRRGLYTGAYGTVGHDGGLTLAMAIRTAVFGTNGEGEYFTGGGIVADSDPNREVAETRWKATQLGRIANP